MKPSKLLENVNKLPQYVFSTLITVFFLHWWNPAFLTKSSRQLRFVQSRFWVLKRPKMICKITDSDKKRSSNIAYKL